jgi:CheY-like chemotaxis protein
MILIAEDDKAVQRSYTRMLKDHELRIVDDAAIALDLIEAGFRPDLIISDLEMPLVLGTSFCTTLRQKGLKIPFILVSGSFGIANLAQGCGADDWAEKGTLEAMTKIREFAKTHDKKTKSAYGAG